MKNKIKIFSYIILTIFIIDVIKCDITIIGPNELSSSFNNKPIEMIFNRIGKSTYDFYIRGELFLQENTNNFDACQNFGYFMNKDESLYQPDFKILLVKRGDCSFIQKARNSQNAGYSMILIVNNNDFNIKNEIIPYDGLGGDIHIPIAMTSKKDGEKIINFLLNERIKEPSVRKKIIVEINFLKNNDSNNINKIDFKFFFSSSELRAYELLNNISQYIYFFGEQILFTPIYVIHQNAYYKEGNPIRTDNCISKGKFCYFPKETTITQDGKQIILEDLRQKCIYDISLKNKNINNYFNYMKTFYSQCLIKDNIPKFDDQCSRKALRYLGYSAGDIDKCISDSFGVPHIFDTHYIDKDNKILKNEYNEILKYRLTSFPAIIINNKLLKGVIKESRIAFKICNLVKNKPDICYFLYRQHINEIKRKYILNSLIYIFIGVNILIFIIFKKYINRRIDERINNGGLDLDSRIKNVVGNYFSLSELNNDYIKMNTNPSSANEPENQEKKVIEIN